MRFLKCIKKLLTPEFEWKNFSQEEQAKILAADRSNNFLDTNKLQSLFSKC